MFLMGTHVDDLACFCTDWKLYEKVKTQIASKYDITEDPMLTLMGVDIYTNEQDGSCKLYMARFLKELGKKFGVQATVGLLRIRLRQRWLIPNCGIIPLLSTHQNICDCGNVPYAIGRWCQVCYTLLLAAVPRQPMLFLSCVCIWIILRNVI